MPIDNSQLGTVPEGLTIHYSPAPSPTSARSIACPTGEACDIHGCWPDASGTCVPSGGGCGDVWDPVCGCDGTTYDNDCLRLTAGVAADHDGECAGPPPECGGDTGLVCPDGETCNVLSCVMDMGGTCVADPPAPCPTDVEPVCGCNGTTYDNDCLRLTADVALDHAGACTTPPCMPECERLAGGVTRWIDCFGTVICTVNCGGCTVSCLYDGSESEGWYASGCGGGRDGGCGFAPGLVAYDDCM